MSKSYPKKIFLPQLTITKIDTENFTNTNNIKQHNLTYTTSNEQSFNNSFNFFPIVLNKDGSPWKEAVVYILSRLKDTLTPVMGTYASIAEDLAIYKKFLDEEDLEWYSFPSQKLMRPTYRFNGHLKLQIASGEMANSTAKRTMGTVISFYRWISEENLLSFENLPWKEKDKYVEFKNQQGFSISKLIKETDLNIKNNQQNNPYDGTIEDGGKLRPLNFQEQQWLFEALNKLGNIEMKLIHLLSLLTGARIQTVLTFKIKHLNQKISANALDIKIPIGPGTGIDSKNDKKMFLYIPVWFYKKLQIYAQSERATKRRLKAQGGDTENQYLFLTVRSSPFYQEKQSVNNFNPSNKLRHLKIGQGVRQYIFEKIIPFIQENYDKNFTYRFHDLRATAGMNWTDFGLTLVEKQEITLKELREFVKTKMGHESSSTTDLYLQYRKHQQLTEKITLGYEDWIKQLSINGVKE